MGARRRRLRAMMLIVIGTLLAAVAVVVAVTDPLAQLELATVDTRFAIRGPEKPPDDIVLVRIDDRTFDDLHTHQFPFRRRLHARVIDNLRRAGARVIVYDVQFTEPSDRPRDDQALIDAAVRAGPRLVLATTEVNQWGETAIFGSNDVLRQTRARAGNALLPIDPDGVVRRFPRAVDGLDSVAVVAVRAANRPLPRFDHTTAWIDFHGPPGIVPSVSFSQVYAGRVDPARLRGKIVVVGLTAPSAGDVHLTSTTRDAQMSGAEVHANAISTLLRGLPLSRAPSWVTIALTGLLSLVLPLCGLAVKGVRIVGLAVLIAVAYGIVVQVAFDGGLILPVVYPFGAVALAVVGTIAVGYTTAAYERERVRELFTRYVPERVVNEVLASTDDDLRLNGKRLQATVMFCDLRDFTAFAELRPAERVIDVLNQYLDDMSEGIRARDGTVLAYMGDGIFAVFGAPIEQDDHADRAVEAARDLTGPRMEKLNAWLRDHNLGDGFRIGIGLNSGVVMAGNVGCQWRVEYTVVGDTVNTASRLEKMTKGSPYPVLISDTTRAMLRRDAPDLRYIDAMSVRGKVIKVNLWTIDSAPSAEPEAAPTPLPADVGEGNRLPRQGVRQVDRDRGSGRGLD